MARLEDEEFKNWKASKGKSVKKVNEGFLDDEDTEDLDAYDMTQNDEGDSYVEDIPDQDAAAEDEEDPDAEDDLVGDSDEETPVETEDGEQLDDGVTDEESVDTNAQLADAIATLTQTVQQLSDKLAAEKQPTDDTEDSDDFGDLDFGDDEEEEDDEESDEDTEEDSEEDSEEDADEEGDEDSEDEDDGSDEDYEGDDDDEEDSEKSEAYNANLKHGKLLNSKSGSLIGTLLAGKMYQLDEQILAVAKAKIRQRIEERKRAIRANGFED